MKKTLLLGVIGLAASMASSSYGQGFVVLDNYNAPGSLVTYGANVPADGVSGALGTPGTGLLSGWTVGLYYVVGNPAINDPASIGIPASPLALATGLGSTVDVYDSSGAAGVFFANDPFAVPGGAAGGTVTLELVAYSTAAGSYAAAAYRGHSDPFTITMQSATTLPPTALVGYGFQTFGIAPVPEPTTLALAGLGAAALMIFRKRKA